MQSIDDQKRILLVLIIIHVYIAPEPSKPVLRRCTVLLSLTQFVSTQHKSQLPREHTIHAAIKGAKRNGNP